MLTRVVLLAAFCSCMSDQLSAQAEQRSAEATRLAMDSALIRYRQADNPGGQAAALGRVATLLNDAGQRDSALAVFRTVLLLARAAHDTVREAWSHRWLGYLYDARGALDTTVQHYREALRLRAALGQSDQVIVIHRLLGETFERANRPDSALAHLALSIAGSSDSTSNVFAATVGGIGRMYWQQRQADSAVGAFLRAARLSKSGNRRGEAAVWTNWACFVRVGSGTLPNDAIRLCTDALAQFRGLGPDSAPHEQVLALRRLATVLRQQKLVDTALPRLREAAALSARSNRHDESEVWFDLGTTFDQMNVADSAAAAFGRAAIIYRERGETSDLATTLNWQCYEFAAAPAPPDEAVVACREALALVVGDSTFDRRARTRERLARILRRRGARDSAALYLDRAVDEFAEAKLPVERARALRALCEWRIDADNAAAMRNCRESAVEFRRLARDDSTLRRDEARALQLMGWAYRRFGQEDSACAVLQTALSIQESLGNRGGQAAVLGDLGVAYRTLKQFDSAAAVYSRAITLRRALADDSSSLNQLLVFLGATEQDRRRPAAAIAAYREALAYFKARHDALVVSAINAGIANAFMALGQPDSAQLYLTGATAGAPPSADDLRHRMAQTRSTGDSNGFRQAVNSLAHLFAVVGTRDSALVYYALGRAEARAAHDVDAEIVALMGLAKLHAELGAGDSAVAEYTAAAALGESAGQVSITNAARSLLSALYREHGQLDSALSYARAVQAGWERAHNERDALTGQMLVAAILEQQGHFESAIAVTDTAIRRAKLLGDHKSLGAFYGMRGTSFSSLGQYDSALVDLQISLTELQRAGSHDGEQHLLGALGSVFRFLGRIDSALAYHRLAITAGLEGITPAFANMALDFEAAGVRDSALWYQKMRLAFADPDDRAAMADALAQLSSLYEGLAEPDTAAAYLQRALAMLTDSLKRTPPALVRAELLGDIGNLYQRTGQLDSALVYETLSLSNAREHGEQSAEALALTVIGSVQARLGNPVDALASLRGALASNRAAGAREATAGTLNIIGRSLRRLPTPDRHGALAAFDSASVDLAAVRQHAGADANRIGLAEQALSRSAPGEWEMTWLSIADSIGMEQAAFGALAASERSRAQALLDLMRRTATDLTPGRDLVADGRRLLATPSGAAVLSFLVTEDTLVRWLAVPGTPLRVSREAVRWDTLGTLVRSFRAALGVGAAARSGIASRSGDALEADTLDVLRSGVAPSAARKNAQPLSNRLAKLLLPPDLQHSLGTTRELVIVPHGVLGLVPFAALPLDSSNTPFGSVYALRYSPSLAVLRQVESRTGLPTGATRTAALSRAVVIGNPTMPATSAWGEAFTFSALPGATQEAAAVAAPLGVRTLTGSQATETEVRRRLPTAPVVHLATHGFAYSKEARARFSFVALAPDDHNDGFLTVGEILDDPALALSADLVVLSACQTGLGDLKQAEGTVGLQRALLAKGARSVLVSLWNVSDQATALLMKRFYAHWLGDPDRPSKAEALRRAQEEVRREPRFADPRFWAAFQLVGAR